MLKQFQRLGQKMLLPVESSFSRVFGPEGNPLYHLGALSFFFFWVIAVSGIYLYIFFETSITGAYDSVESLTHGQWYFGGVMRSLHRYASDALVIVMMLHLVREFIYDRYRGFRWFSWVTGVPLLWLAFASGINGYWLVWDRLAQYIAVGTAEWLDWVPIFTEPMARNFLNENALSDRFFSLLSFLHIGIPLALLLGMWIHIQRVTQPKVNPPRTLMFGTLAALLALSFILPAVSHPPANLDSAPTSLNPDWFYLFLYPLIDATSAGNGWALAGTVTLLLTVMPWLPRPRPEPVAEVDPVNCNGCSRCFADCPFGAVVMQAHPEKPGHLLAVVSPELCASCGICAGACPSSTPFRSVEELVTGIDMPQLTVQMLRAATGRALEGLSGESRVVVYGCDHGADVRALAGPGVAAFSLPCIGQLPPSFVDYVLRENRADGVFITGCSPGNCYFRYGNTWTEQRFHHAREPHLRTRTARERTHIFWAAENERGKLSRALEDYRRLLRELPPMELAPPRTRKRRHDIALVQAVNVNPKKGAGGHG